MDTASKLSEHNYRNSYWTSVSNIKLRAINYYKLFPYGESYNSIKITCVNQTDKTDVDIFVTNLLAAYIILCTIGKN